MNEPTAKQSAVRLKRAVKAGQILVAEEDYAVCGIRKGDKLIYDKSAKPAIGLAVVASTTGETAGKLRPANFLDYEIAPTGAEASERANADRTCVLEWDGEDEQYIEGVAYPVSHVIVPGCGVVALDLGLESPDDGTMSCKIQLDAMRTFGPLLRRLEV